MSGNKKDFVTGDKVFAKVKGYPPWPAKIDNVNGKKYHVTFYGTKETGVLKITDLFPYREYRQQFTTKYLKKRDFAESIDEIEADLSDDEDKNNSKEDDTHSTNKNVNKIKTIEVTESPKVVISPKREKSTPSSRKSVKRKLDTANETPNIKAKTQVLENFGFTKIANTTATVLQEVKEEPNFNETDNEVEQGEEGEEEIEGIEELNEVDDDTSKMEESEDTEYNENEEIYEIILSDTLEKKIKNDEYNAENKTDEDKISETPQILVAVIPDGTFVGIKYKLNVNEISDFEERRAHMLDTIRNILKFKADLEEGAADVNDFKNNLIINPHLSVTQRIKILEAHIMKHQSRKLDWLRIESKLIKLEGEIKSHLGLEKANTKLALQCLNQIDELQIEQLMLVKHPFVIDVIKRLRRYIGNLQLWGLSSAESKTFLSDSENIRNKADDIYQKFKELFTIEAGETFADVYQAKIRDFKANIKDLSETDRFTLCEWPGTPKFLHDRIIDNLLSELEQLRRRLFETNNISQ